MIAPNLTGTELPPAPDRTWRPSSVALIVLLWLLLHVGTLFSPGLLDDVDSVYLEVAREMLTRHDLVTPFVDGIRFFDKPPLMYWLAAASMRLFGPHDWAGRLPLAILTLALLLTTYALGNHLFCRLSPHSAPDRAGLYAALALATAIGPFLYTRFFLPDIALTLWLALAILFFLIALDRAHPPDPDPRSTPAIPHSPLWPMLGFAAALAANSLTKGLIGVVLTLAFALTYLAAQRQLCLLRRLHLPSATLLFLLLAAPWHVLAALRNPAIPMPPGVGLPPHAGWAWFYLYNEHIARFLSRRIPHDYGQVPIPLFWLLALLWIFPWVAFLPSALRHLLRTRRGLGSPGNPRNPQTPVILSEGAAESKDPRISSSGTASGYLNLSPRENAPLAVLLWATLVLAFFTVSARQEYYSLPALPAFALAIGALLARADQPTTARHAALRTSFFILVPLGLILALVAGYFALTAPTPPPAADIADILARASTDPADYNLSLSHLADLSAASMGFFRAPLLLLAFSMLALGPVSYFVRRSGRTFAANLVLAAAATGVLLSIHGGLTRFYPTLGSKPLALAVLHQQHLHPRPDDLLLIDGELTTGSSLLFYTGQPAHLVNGRINGPWFGSFWPDAPPVFESDSTLHQLWPGPRRLFLLTTHPAARTADLAHFAPVHTLAAAGGKEILTNR